MIGLVWGAESARLRLRRPKTCVRRSDAAQARSQAPERPIGRSLVRASPPRLGRAPIDSYLVTPNQPPSSDPVIGLATSRMISTHLLRQAVRTPAFARLSSTAAAPAARPAYKRAYTRSSPSTYKRAMPTTAAALKSTPAAAPSVVAEESTLPIEDAVPEEAVPTPLAHTIDDMREPSPAPSPAQVSETAAKAWADSGMASGSFPSAPINQTTAPEIDWTTSFYGLSAQAFSKQAGETLMRPLLSKEIEIKPG